MTVLTVTLNAAIDKRYDVASLTVGAVQRVERVHASAGGKGLNVSRGARLCGEAVIATGFLAGFAGQFIAGQLLQQEIRDEFIRVSGETRTCINIIDTEGHSTELLEPGVDVTSDDLARLLDRYAALLPETDVVTLSGSAPRGCPAEVYVPLIEAAQNAGRPTILDTSGPLLAAAAAAGPSVVKPNRDELAALTGTRLDDLDAVVRAARSLCSTGPEWVVVSLGKAGAIAVSLSQAVEVSAPRVEVRNPVGCGDVLVGGLASGLATGQNAAEALPRAVCAATASAAHPATGRFDPVLAERLRAPTRSL